MKKLSVLIALALVLTIGGAYATWTYYTTVPDSVSGTIGVSITTAEVVDAGTLEINDETPFDLSIDDKGNYVAGFSANAGEIVITFTTDANIHEVDPAYTKGIEIPVTITTSGIGTYKGSPAIGVITAEFSILPAGSSIDGTNDLVWEGEKGEFTCTISAEKIVNCLKIGDGNVVLDTKTEYDEFDKALRGGNAEGSYGSIKVTIGDPDAN